MNAISIGVFLQRKPNIFELYRETFPAAAGARRIWIVEIKTFTIQPAGKFERSVAQIQETLQIGDNFHAIVFKDLVIRARFIIKVHLIRQPGAASAGHGYPHEKIVG